MDTLIFSSSSWVEAPYAWPAPLYLGVRPNKARHSASKMVDLPAPVGPVIAKVPACASGPVLSERSSVGKLARL